MTDQNRPQQSPEALYDQKIEQYLKGRVALRAHDFGTTEETSEALWNHLKSTVAIKLDDDSNVTYNGSPKTSTLDVKILALREKLPELFPRFGKSKEEASVSTQETPREVAKTTPSQVPAKELIVSEADTSDSRWMRKYGLQHLADGTTLFDAIAKGAVRVVKDASKATLNVDRDLSVDLGAKTKELPTTVVPRGRENDRLYLLKIEQKYASIGGFTEAVRRNLVTFER